MAKKTETKSRAKPKDKDMFARETADEALKKLEQLFEEAELRCTEKKAKPLFKQMHTEFCKVAKEARSKKPNSLDTVRGIRKSLGHVLSPLSDIWALTRETHNPRTYAQAENIEKSVGWFGDRATAAILNIRKKSKNPLSDI